MPHDQHITRLLQQRDLLAEASTRALAHDAPDAQVSQDHLPDALRGRVYYRPTTRGAEKEIAERLAKWRAWREKQKPA